MKKIIIGMLLLISAAISSVAQDQATSGYSPSSLYTLSYTISIPMGSFNDFMQNASFTGGNFTGRYFLTKKIAVGFEFGWSNYYKEYPRMTFYDDKGTAITGIHYTYAFLLPWKAGFYYYFMPESVATPYLGLGLGGDYMEEHILVQEYDVYDTQWGFTMSPEFGALVKFGKYSHWAANISAQYWFNTNSFSFTDSKSYSFMQGINFNVGVSYLLK
jgi:hypothetical protein